MIATRRWQDWTVAVIGALVALSPLAFTSTWSDTTAYSAYILGGLIVVAGVGKLLLPKAAFFEWAEVGLAAVLFFSPWLVGFTTVMAMAWTAWIASVGIVLVIGSLFTVEGRPAAATS